MIQKKIYKYIGNKTHIIKRTIIVLLSLYALTLLGFIIYATQTTEKIVLDNDEIQFITKPKKVQHTNKKMFELIKEYNVTKETILQIHENSKHDYEND